VRRKMLDEGLLKVLSGFLEVSEERPLALASYISYPGSREVVNSLRVAICPHTPFPDCDAHCSRDRSRNAECSACTEHPEGNRECDQVSMITDRHLFQRLLSPGERSGVFGSRSSIVRERYGEHRVYFFYLHVGEEVARVEVPEWVAQRPDLLDLTHAVLLDQCERGHGYPVAISEAHEQAVVTGSDREEFWQMVDIAMGGTGLSPVRSAKAASKPLKPNPSGDKSSIGPSSRSHRATSSRRSRSAANSNGLRTPTRRCCTCWGRRSAQWATTTKPAQPSTAPSNSGQTTPVR
ncbi:MAG: DNA double-strand break repair nuclease NurA, partial [Chloroflexi bacterium]|nr:DNA double-strand break repair nuclease NurA [Chloroflexota bacterium]